MLSSLAAFNSMLIGWPFIGYVLGIAVLCTIVFSCVQVRCFGAAWRWMFAPQDTGADQAVDMSPLQAFMSTLSANLGNASLAGVATALYSGGPGAAIWMVIIGMFLMAVRYAEVFLGIKYAHDSRFFGIGGPMRYLRDVPVGRILAAVYGFVCLIFSLLIGNAFQTNSIRDGLLATFGIPPLVTAVALALFIAYVLAGGAQRVGKLSDALVPTKVLLFMAVSLAVFANHWSNLLSALQLMVAGAFGMKALAGGVLGASVQQAMRYGILRSIYATEAGLGTAAILYSATGSKTPEKDATVSMLSVFVSTLVCFVVAWLIVASGALATGLNGLPLTIAAYEPTFGSLAGWVVTFLSITFGMGVLVAFTYISKQAWLSVTGGRFAQLFAIMFVAVGFLGALVDVSTVVELGDTVNATLLILNLFGIMWLCRKISVPYC